MIIPFKFNIVCPENFKPNMDLVKKAQNIGISEINLIHNPYEGVKEADFQIICESEEKARRKSARITVVFCRCT